MKKYIGIILTLGILCLNGLWAEWTWTELPSAGSRDWEAITSSSDGTKLAAVEYNGYIYTSTDSGTTWTEQTAAGSRYWRSITSSSDGMKLAAASDDGGYIYTSTDGGGTWTEQTAVEATGWLSIASSDDGTKLAATTAQGHIYISSDSGKTWAEKQHEGGYYISIVSSSDGTKLVACNVMYPYGGYLSVSTDSGNTWVSKYLPVSTFLWTSLAMSSDGTKLAICGDSQYIYTSTDCGDTWTEQAAAGNKAWKSIVSSSDGTKLAAVSGGWDESLGNYIYTSIDGGATWTTQNAGSKKWISITSSDDGSKVAACAKNDNILVGNDPSLANGETGETTEYRKIVRTLPKIQLINQDAGDKPVSVFEIDETVLNIGTIADSVFDDVVITRNLQGPQLSVPETNPIAATINAANGAISAKAIFYDVNNAAIFMNGTQITGTDGTVFAGYENYVKNVSYNAATRTLTFDVTHFTEYGVKALTGLTFTGTAGNAQILAPGSNLALRVLGVTINGAVTQNIITPVERIHGLAYETVVAALSQNVGVYSPVIPGQDYGFAFEYINRGNATDVVQLAHTMTNANFATSITENAQSIAPWQAVYFDLKFNASNATQALERSTLNVTVSLDQSGYVAGEDHRVQYTPFFGAVSSTFNDEGIYGGLGGFSYQFILEAQGYNLKIITRNATISYPADYTGVTGNIIPGAKVTYEIVLQNLSNTIANNIVMGDKVPNSCHVLVTDPTCTPNVDGAMAWTWLGATENANTAEAVKYDLTIPPLGIVTASYTVTID